MQRGTNSGDPEFAGFFSTAAIEEAMALANKLRGGVGADGEDGTSDDTTTHNSNNDAAATDNDADDSDGT